MKNHLSGQQDMWSCSCCVVEVLLYSKLILCINLEPFHFESLQSITILLNLCAEPGRDEEGFADVGGEGII